MLQVLKSLKSIIERFIVNRQSLTQDAVGGTKYIYVDSTRRFLAEDKVFIYDQPSELDSPAGEMHMIEEIIDNNTLKIYHNLSQTYAQDASYIQKLIGTDPGEQDFVKHIFVGDPPVIRSFPAICIDAGSQSAEWFTLESIQDTFEVNITVYIQQQDYQRQYELMMQYAKAIRLGLFRSMYPLVEPYLSSPLVGDINADSIDFKIEDDELFACSWGLVYFESRSEFRTGRITEYLGNGVYRLNMPLGREFSAGDQVIMPTRHIYSTIPHSVDYGTINKEGTMLKAAVISWRGLEEVRIGVPFIDPLMF